MLEVMQASNDPAVYAQCQAPSVTWGLLDRAQQYKWYKGDNTFTAQVNMQDIATHGPSGVRLRMFAVANGLTTNIHSNVLSTHDPENPAYNFVHQHSIAQPYCESNKAQLFKDDLRQHFSDVLFPMAHTVHVSPVSAYCSTWAIEHAILTTLQRTLDPEHEAMLQQVDVERTARTRCFVQLEQIGICQLRGVFEMPPPGTVCPSFLTSSPATNLACDCSWLLPNDLIACQGADDTVQFYDPAKCLELSTCTATDMALAFDPRAYATDDVQLRSLHWPDEIPSREAGDGTIAAMAERIARIKEHQDSHPIDLAALRREVDAQLVSHDIAHVEEEAPDSFCDDLYDWYPADAQHPVGYHPTTTMTHETTHVRGFDAWMSGYTDVDSHEYDYVIDPRMRNSTTASRFFGAANLVCDARTYGRLLREPKSYYLETSWDANTASDPAVPGLAETVLTWSTTGVNTEQSARHTPLLQAWEELTSDVFEDDFIQHQAGLVRNWLRYDTTVTDDKARNFWPNWLDTERVGEYGSADTSDAAHDACSEHPVKLCRVNTDCYAGQDLVCLLVPVEDDAETDQQGIVQRGVCAKTGTCFAHEHCITTDANTLCSGNGQCEPAEIVLKNELGVEIDLQLFSDVGDFDSTGLEDTAGFSEYQRVTDFANRQGMCSLFNWQTRYNATDGDVGDYGDWTRTLHLIERVDDTSMKQYPHPCDRSWQHTRMKAHGMDPVETKYDTQDMRVAYTRTWLSDNTRAECDFPQHRKKSNIISPYSYWNDDTNDYQYDLNNIATTVQRCSKYNLCPVLQFSLEHETVPKRLSLATKLSTSTLLPEITPGITSVHNSRTKALCGAAGQQTTDGFCVLDQLVVPLAAVVYRIAGMDVDTLAAAPPGDLLAPYVPGLSAAEQARLGGLVVAQCPYARTEIWSTMHVQLMRHYQQNDDTQRQAVARAANQLLPALFGLDFNSQNFMTLPSAWTLEEYLQHVQCAEWLFGQMEALQNNLPNLYQRDPRLNRVRPGTSLYMFHDRAHVELPFHWFWKCVLLHPNPHVDWLEKLGAGIGVVKTDAATLQSQHVQTCGAEIAQSEQDKVTVKERLRSAPSFFERDIEIIAMQVESLAIDVDATLARGLDELGLREFPDLFSMKISALCEGFDHEYFPTKYEVDSGHACVTKYGRDLSQTLLSDVDATVEEILADPTNATLNPLLGTGLRAEARLHLFGDVSHANLMLKTLSDLKTESKIHVLTDAEIAEHRVANNANFIPRLQFSTTVPELPDQPEIFDDSGIKSNYATLDAEDGVYELLSKEYMRYKPPAGHPAGNTKYHLYLTEEQALRELLQWFYRDIYTTPTFRSQNLFVSPGQIPGAAATADADDEIDYSTAYRFNAAMQERTFECTDSNELDENAITSELQGQLRGCLRAMQHDLGLRVPADEEVTMSVTGNVMLQGFYPAYSEHSVGEDQAQKRGFLEALTSDDVGEKVFDSFCFSNLRKNSVDNINMLWSGLFDLDSGCDLKKFGAGANVMHVVRDDVAQPPHCVAGTRVDFAGNGTLIGSETPLCERVPEPATVCHRRTGTLGGNRGAMVNDLMVEYPLEYERGLFSSSVFRRSTRFTPAIRASTTALAYRRNDLGGHKISFKVSETGQLLVDCVHISDAQQCRDWLHNLEEFWSMQHKAASPTPRTQRRQPWTCPMRLVSQWSGRRHQHQPNIPRNRVRFGALTGAYDSVHPLIASSRVLTQLRPARFMSEAQMCLHANTEKVDCQHSNHLDKTIEFVTRDAYMERETVSSMQAGESCDQVLDWPHQKYTLRDGSFTRTQYEDIERNELLCRPQDRLPGFQIKLTDMTTQSTETMSSTQGGGPCHMARLQRVAPPTTAEKAIQDCVRGDVLRCRVWNSANKQAEQEEYTMTPPSNDISQSNKLHRCADAFAAQGVRGEGVRRGVLDTGLDPSTSRTIHDMSTAANTKQQLSLGIPTRVKTSRAVAAHLRRILCPEASDVACEGNLAANTGIPATGWDDVDVFLTNFMSSAEPSAVEAAAEITEDNTLWERPWVFCENTESCVESDATFQNYIDKATWLESSTRLAKCAAKMTAAPSTTVANVNFCLLTSQMTKLCEDLAQWKVRLHGILCRAGGVDECPESAFFYNPTTYSVSNREFVYDTVQNFYDIVFPGQCTAVGADGYTDNTDYVAEQIASNEATKVQCVSTRIAPLKQLLIAMRGIKGLIIEILFYSGQIMMQLLNLLVALITDSVSNQVRDMQAAGDAILMYLGMLFATIADIVTQIMRGIFAVVFRDGLPAQIISFIQDLCHFVNFLHEHILGTSPTTGALCPIFNALGNVLQDLAGSLDTVPFMPAGIIGAVNATGNLLLTVLPCSETALMECSFDDAVDDGPEPTGALPVATRCSASYQSFFGDNTPLSCTRADTCHRSMLDSSRVACALCPAAASTDYDSFGCEPYTKLCTCNVQQLSVSSCVRNDDCRAAPNCRYTDRLQQAAFGAQPCSTCAHERFCHIESVGSAGFCACGLQPVRFSSCDSTYRGLTVHVKSGDMCLLTRDTQTMTSQLSSAFGLLATTPCDVVVANTVRCMQITDSRGDASGYYAVAHQQLRGFGRRLLGAPDAPGPALSLQSHSGLCRDAAVGGLGSVGNFALSNVHRECEEACARSVETVGMLNAQNVRNFSIPELTFCSQADLLATVQQYPLLPLSMLADPPALRLIIARHTHLRHLVTYARSLQTALDAFAHDALVRKKLETETNTSQANKTTQATPSRHLLQMTDGNIRTNRYDAMDAFSFAFDNVLQDVSLLHGSYANDLAAVSDTNYPPLHSAENSEQNIWLSTWPPQYTDTAGAAAGSTCQPLLRVVELSLQAGNASLRHFTTYPPTQPSNLLADAWPAFARKSAQSADTQAKPPTDWLTDIFNALVAGALELVGLGQNDVRGWAYTLIENLPDWVRCDIDRLQTCSGWRARLPNAFIVSWAFFGMWYALLFQLNLGFLASLSMPLFGLLMLYTAYGYSLLCVPLVPPCLLLDFYQSLEALFPMFIDLPAQMYIDNTCAHTSTVNATCLVSCQVAPWQYRTWQDPLAWLLAELGQGAADFTFDILQYVPFYDLQPLRDAVLIKVAMLVQGDAGTLFVHRVCALTSSYLLLPYAVLAAVVAFGGVAALVVATRLLMPAAMLFSSLLVAAFTE